MVLYEKLKVDSSKKNYTIPSFDSLVASD